MHGASSVEIAQAMRLGVSGVNAAMRESTATTIPTSIPSAFVGTWKVFYDNDAVRTYAITAAGTVIWTHTHGKPGPNKESQDHKSRERSPDRFW